MKYDYLKGVEYVKLDLTLPWNSSVSDRRCLGVVIGLRHPKGRAFIQRRLMPFLFVLRVNEAALLSRTSICPE
jgi:hypothetical protein